QLKDLNNDGLLELITGNQRGGISMYRDENSVAVSENGISNSSFLIYPNPTENIITFEGVVTENLTVSIYTVDGRMVKKEQFTLGTNKLSCDVINLNPGIYFVAFTNAESRQIFTGKFIKY
ncbi:MAG: T9SS type A sorting domain-containing protein, partial [Chitinophagales bacterium]|nr:T9SS type A sorting domain-containing protein [Chitinophagales bacterium]